MKILFVAPWVPSQLRPRSLALLQMLAADHEVRFLSLVHDEAEARLADDLPVLDRTLVPNPGRVPLAGACTPWPPGGRCNTDMRALAP